MFAWYPGTRVDVLTNYIYICSVERSTTNFPQYEHAEVLPEKGLVKSLNTSSLPGQIFACFSNFCYETLNIF